MPPSLSASAPNLVMTPAMTHPCLTSRLPLWMKRGQNRADVLKGIARLKRLLE